MSYFACFDVGGTNIKYGLVSESGQLLFSDQCTSPKGSADDLVQLLSDLIAQLQRKVDVLGVGISIHGVVDINAGCITCGSHFVTELVGFPLVSILQDTVSLPVYLENDVNAAALGECWKGAAVSQTNVAFLTLGSSIGGALIINKQLYRGRNFCAGEFGYLITNEQEQDDHAFMPGSWERKASASVLLNQYRKALSNPRATEKLFEEALLNHDETAKAIFDQFLDSVTSGLVSIAHVFAPDAIIIGGAITLMGDTFLQPLVKRFNARALPVCQGTEIQLTKLGNHAALIGMARMSSTKICF